MRRREFIALLGSGVTGWSLAAWAQQGGRGRRIVALMSMAADDPEAQPRVAAFESGLRELGWLEGRNLQIEYRWVSDGDLLRRNAAELARTPPDLILATSTPVMAALREQGLSVPIMFVQVTDPVGQGLVPNLARPGGHITGFTNFEFSIGTKWLDALKQIAPRVTRVALIYNPETAPHAYLFQRPVEAAAPAFAVTPITVAARSAAELERAVDAFARTPTGGLLVLPDVTELDPSRSDHCAGGTPSPAGGLPISLLCRERRSAVLWQRTGRRVPARGLLCRPHSQRHESGRTTRAGADQIRAGAQPENRQGARP